MINIVNGNVLNATENIIGHQTNCLGIMGAGLALRVKVYHNNVYVEYKELCKQSGESLLGTYQLVQIGTDKYIANLFGQNGIFGMENGGTDYNALRQSLISLVNYAQTNNLSVALPYNLGCGLGGGRWDMVYGIIQDVFENYDVTLYNIDEEIT